MRIRCRTYFDITATGVRSHFKPSRIPFRDDSGAQITDMGVWNRSRNKQRNWETINQIIALRCLPEYIATPEFDSESGAWQFEFDVPNIEAVSSVEKPLDFMLQDCANVPMIVGLDERHAITPLLDPDVNVWFELIAAK
jgi:hypothetical protein